MMNQATSKYRSSGVNQLEIAEPLNAWSKSVVNRLLWLSDIYKISKSRINQ